MALTDRLPADAERMATDSMASPDFLPLPIRQAPEFLAPRQAAQEQALIPDISPAAKEFSLMETPRQPAPKQQPFPLRTEKNFASFIVKKQRRSGLPIMALRILLMAGLLFNSM